MSKIQIIITLLILCIVPTNLLATSIVETNTHEENIDLEQAISFGFIPSLFNDEAILEKYRHDLVTFRVEKPKQVGECTVWFATIQLLANHNSVTEYQMTEIGTNDKWYFSARINPDVIDEVTVRVWCKDTFDVDHNHSHNQIYIFSVDLYAM